MCSAAPPQRQNGQHWQRARLSVLPPALPVTPVLVRQHSQAGCVASSLMLWRSGGNGQEADEGRAWPRLQPASTALPALCVAPCLPCPAQLHCLSLCLFGLLARLLPSCLTL